MRGIGVGRGTEEDAEVVELGGIEGDQAAREDVHQREEVLELDEPVALGVVLGIVGDLADGPPQYVQ